MKKIILIIAVLISCRLKATTITSVICGNWSDINTWDLQRIPQSTDTIMVNTFVSFDVDFTSVNPGILEVTDCGTLCGLHNYTGCFLLYGVVYINTFHLIYGVSYSSSPSFNVLSYGTVTNTGTQFTSTGSLCVGCTSNCQNCSTNNKEETACNQNGIAQIKNQNTQLKLYPNPTSSTIQITSITNQAEILIYDVLGNEVLQSKQTIIDVSSLASGLYFVHVGTRIQKFVKQ